MKNKKNVDKCFDGGVINLVFQHKLLIYTHGHKNGVDNVYKFTHIKKCFKFKVCWIFRKMNTHRLHKVIHNLSTKCG